MRALPCPTRSLTGQLWESEPRASEDRTFLRTQVLGGHSPISPKKEVL